MYWYVNETWVNIFLRHENEESKESIRMYYVMASCVMGGDGRKDTWDFKRNVYRIGL